jgi:hypothetical protein
MLKFCLLVHLIIIIIIIIIIILRFYLNLIIGFGNKIEEKRDVRKEKEKEYKTYIKYI